MPFKHGIFIALKFSVLHNLKELKPLKRGIELMNSLNYCLTKVTARSGLLVLIILMLGLNYGSASAKVAINATTKQSAGGKGKIVMLKLATESPQKQSPTSADILAQQSASTRIQLQRTTGKRTQQTASAKTQTQSAESKQVQQPVSKNQSSDAPAPATVATQHNAEKIVEPPVTQGVITSEPLPASQPSSFADPQPQPLTKKNMAADNMNEDIRTISKISDPEITPPKESIQDMVGIITRLLLKFSLITVCCITLFFSFSALQIAKSNQRIQDRVGEEKGIR